MDIKVGDIFIGRNDKTNEVKVTQSEGEHIVISFTHLEGPYNTWYYTKKAFIKQYMLKNKLKREVFEE